MNTSSCCEKYFQSFRHWKRILLHCPNLRIGRLPDWQQIRWNELMLPCNMQKPEWKSECAYTCLRRHCRSPLLEPQCRLALYNKYKRLRFCLNFRMCRKPQQINGHSELTKYKNWSIGNGSLNDKSLRVFRNARTLSHFPSIPQIIEWWNNSALSDSSISSVDIAI